VSYVQSGDYASAAAPASCPPLHRDVRPRTAAFGDGFYSVCVSGGGVVEVLLLLWDEMDDWVGTARHYLRSLT
jgi:hypothetical protein